MKARTLLWTLAPLVVLSGAVKVTTIGKPRRQPRPGLPRLTPRPAL